MQEFPLDDPLLTFNGSSHWTLRHAIEGIQIFGGIGSGKTSGSGFALASKYLKAGYGGLVLTVKPNEYRDNWYSYCQDAGRLDDVILLKPGGNYRFNFLNYELTREGIGSGLVDNLVNTLKTVIRAGEDHVGRANDAFWDDALDMLLFNVIDLCYLAYGRSFSLDQLFAVTESLPKDINTLQRDDIKQKSAFYQAYKKAREVTMDKVTRAKVKFEEDNTGIYNNLLDPSWRHFNKIIHYFSHTYADLNPKTRSIIEHSFAGLLFRLGREPIYSLLCSPTPNLHPEMCLDGKVIILDLPVKEYDKIGRDAQILFKYIWQRSMERRDISKNGRPVFLWADEAQNFLHDHDIDYQATARSSRICTVYLTQNLPNYYAHMGGREGEYRVKSFLGTMGTKVFHANSDVDTNLYASDLFGQVFIEDQSQSYTMSGEMNLQTSRSYKLEQAVRPEQFIQLRTGGPLNDFSVEAYIHRQGTPWTWLKDDQQVTRNFKKIQFKQPVNNNHL